MSRPEPETLGATGGADETKVCPFCAETIKAAAIKCRFCQSDLSATLDHAPEHSRPTGPVPGDEPPDPGTSPEPVATTDPPEPAGEVRGRGPLPGRTRLVLVGAAVVSILATLVLGVLTFGAWRETQDAEAAGAAGRAARATVPASLETLLSYEWSTFDEDLEAASAVMTPSFREEYLPTVEAVRERALEQERTQQATVVAVSVVSQDGDEVETLVFLNRTTFTEDSSQQRVLQDRANVTVVREDGEWLIDDITFPTA